MIRTQEARGEGSDDNPPVEKGPCSGDFILRSQAEVDAMAGCAVVNNLTIGDLFQTNDPITSLDNLSQLFQVENTLRIEYTQLTSLSGLENLRFVRNQLIINRNGALESLAALQGLLEVGSIEIANNVRLPTLEGLPGMTLTSIPGSLRIYDNNLLTSIEALRGITEIGGTLSLLRNRALESLSGLQEVTQIGLFEVNQCPIKSFDGLQRLESIDTYFQVFENRSLVTMEGLENLARVGQYFYLRGNETLLSLSGLEGLTRVGSSFSINRNSSLVDISSLENFLESPNVSISENSSLDCAAFALPFFPVHFSEGNLVNCNEAPTGRCDGPLLLTDQSELDNLPECSVIDGDFTIGPSESIDDLSRLDSLRVILGDLTIVGNSALRSLAGLEGLVTVEGTTSIQGNPLLDCSSFQSPFLPVDVSIDNFVDCPTYSAVIEATPERIEYGGWDTGVGRTEAADVRIVNRGTGNLVFHPAGVALSGPHARDFVIAQGLRTSSLPPGESTIVEIAFDPSTSGQKQALLEIRSNSAERPVVQITLSGTGFDASYRNLDSPNGVAGGQFGRSVGSLPDVNGDGRAEVLIGAPGESPPGSTLQPGIAHLFDASEERSLRTLESPQGSSGGLFGRAVSGIRDLNGDGLGDTIVGAPQVSGARGRTSVMSGVDGKLIHGLTSPDDLPNEQFGFSVAAVPDANGDGWDEIVVGAPNAENFAGRAYLFDGSRGLLIRPLSSPNPDGVGQFGFSVAGMQDANGDGCGEVIVGAPGESPLESGRAYVFDGSSGNLLHTFDSPSPVGFGQFGSTVAGIADTNGDDRGDVAIGAENEAPAGFPSRSGRVYLFDGLTGELLVPFKSPNKTLTGNFGSSVSGIDDFDGDGRGDVVVGARGESPSSALPRSGRAYVFSGSSGGLLTTIQSLHQESGGEFGASVSGAGDINGDGLGDLVVGAFLEDTHLADSGRAYVFLSTAAAMEVFPTRLDFGNQDVAQGPSPAETLEFRNHGKAVLRFLGAGVEIGGPDAADFSIHSGTPLYPLISEASEAIELVFDPSSMGRRSATLRIYSNDPSKKNLAIPLTGKGVPLLADQNRDAIVNSLDLLEFLSIWKNGAESPSQKEADQNGDGLLDDFDVFLFAGQWEGGNAR